jgi:predicted lipoprotein with Yx(FWY)xxD motif
MLYLFTRDERNKSNCSGNCLQAWPILTSTAAPTAGEGVAADRLGKLDGTNQVTYNGWPLYYYSQDTAAGDAKGQNVSSVWFAVSADGGPILTNARIKTSTSALGTIVTDNSGRALYLFTRDEGANSACSDNCARNWPPVRTVGAPAAGEGATASLLGTITRQDGSAQVTYGGKPLYYFATDDKPGDTKGQNVGGNWFVVSATGEAIRTAP